MTFDDVVETVRDHMERSFPKTCACGRTFHTFVEYIQGTTPRGPARSYDAEARDWKPAEPLGAFALANCSACRSTLSLTTDGLPLATRHAILDWIRAEIDRRGVVPTFLLEELRAEIRRRALAFPFAGPRANEGPFAIDYTLRAEEAAQQLALHLRGLVVPIAPPAGEELRRSVYEYVDARKGLGEKPEKVLVSLKHVAAEAGIAAIDRRLLTLPDDGRGARRNETLLDQLVRWAIERYYLPLQTPD